MQRYLLALAVLVPLGAARAEPSLTAARVKSEGGLVRLATGVRSSPLPGEPTSAARGFAHAHALALGLSGVQLGEGRAQRTHTGTAVKMPATYRGLPILGQEVVVGLDAKNRVQSVASSVTPIHSASLVRKLDGREALARAVEGLNGVLLKDGAPLGAAREVVFVRDGVAHLAWQVHPVSASLLENWYAVVDAETGAVRSRVNRVFFDAPDGGDTADASSLPPTCVGVDAGTPSDKAMVWIPSPGPTSTRPLVAMDLPNLPAQRDPSGHLLGTLLDAYTCCPNEGCDPTQPAHTLSGTVTYFGYAIPFSTVFCDFQQRASNVLGCRSDYDYSSDQPLTIDPPKLAVGKGDPADDDTFAEVHAYYHANVAYNYIRQVGDPDFVLRDARATPPRKTQVWTNVVMPDESSVTLSGNKAKITKLARIDNSMFLPKESWAELIPGVSVVFDPPDGGAPPQVPQTDAIALFQGPDADFSYDGTVVYHEFTHGVIYSTAAFAGPHISSYGAIDEGGTMHEAIADFYAAAISGNPITAQWIGSRMPLLPNGDGASRNLVNANKCPDDIIGEVHHDSLLFSGATWKMRTQYPGSDQGQTFDGAIFQALNHVTSSAGFAEMSEAIATAVDDVFPGAHDPVLAEYTSRGLTGCVAVLDYTEPRPELYVLGTDSGYSPYAPGPIQFKIAAPSGAGTLVVVADYDLAAHQNPTGGQPSLPDLSALVSVNKPITFTSNFDGTVFDITDDSTKTVSFVADPNAGTVTATADITAAPGDEIHLAIVNNTGSQEALASVTLAVTAPVPAGPDAGPAGLDAAAPGPDASAGLDASAPGLDASQPVADAGTADAGGSSGKSGCGCATAGASPLLLLAFLGLFAVRARRRRG